MGTGITRPSSTYVPREAYALQIDSAIMGEHFTWVRSTGEVLILLWSRAIILILPSDAEILLIIFLLNCPGITRHGMSTSFTSETPKD